MYPSRNDPALHYYEPQYPLSLSLSQTLSLSLSDSLFLFFSDSLSLLHARFS